MTLIRRILLYVQALFYIVAGANHFVNPAMYMAIMPPYLPWPSALHLLAGAAEVMLGALLAIRRTRILAAWGLIALLIAIFPANLYLAQNPQILPGVSPTAHWIRLPFQLVFLAWAYLFTRKPA